MSFARATLRRWDIVRGEGDAWEMVVKTTADVGAGEQLLLSYGERCSDDFFLHYGMGFGVWLRGRKGVGGKSEAHASLPSLSLPNLHYARPLPTLNWTSSDHCTPAHPALPYLHCPTCTAHLLTLHCPPTHTSLPNIHSPSPTAQPACTPARLPLPEPCYPTATTRSGFVPEANPHESVQLFGDLAEALEWHYQRQEAAGKVRGYCTDVRI